MTRILASIIGAAATLCLLQSCSPPTRQQALPDLPPLFNGVDFEGWKVDEVAAKHWKIVDGELEFDGVKGDLWTKASYEDFQVWLEWRWEGKEDKGKQLGLEKSLAPDQKGRDELLRVHA